MLAFEALTQTPKTATLANVGEAAEQASELSFEEFLKGLSKQALTLTPKGSAILSAKETSNEKLPEDPKTMLLTLLQNSEAKAEKKEIATLTKQDDKQLQSTRNDLLTLLKKEPLEEFTLNPVLSQTLSINELKYLLHKAKQYLKTKILQADVNLTKKELPKSLKGLLQLADKLKIEITKISFETITASKETPRNDTPKKSTSVLKQSSITKIERDDDTDTKLKRIETKIEQIKETPLFQSKSSNVNAKTIMTTSQIIENKTKKEQTKRSETTDLLHSLLKKQNQTKQESTNEPLFTNPEKTVKTELQTLQKTVQPKQEEHTQKVDVKSLEELLGGETSLNEIKAQTQKTTESLDVKIHEAKQMMKYLSQDIKKAIEEYKPPFSRVKVKLNPQRLGEMDLTVVQRGKNIHINLSSNNAALNVLTSNLHELRTQLNQNGINNATFNFNSDAHNQQQKNKEHQQGRWQYKYFANDEENEEQSRSLEIIVPQYI